MRKSRLKKTIFFKQHDSIKHVPDGSHVLTFSADLEMRMIHVPPIIGGISQAIVIICPVYCNSLDLYTVQEPGMFQGSHVPKLKDGVRLIIHRRLPKDSRIGNVAFSMDTDGRIFASVEYRYSLKMEMDIRKAVLSKDRTIVDKLSFLGLDYSQQNFYVDSEGRKANYPHWYRKSEAKIIRLQRELSHMEKGSSNYGKQLKKIERLHIKIRNQRLDFVRKEAARLASSYDVIAVENIDLRAMGQTLRLSKNLHDNGFGMFRSILSRKLEEKGSVLVKVDRFFASTKSCSCCGEKSQDVVLGVKEWVCPVCGMYHDRDVNAAINIREEAKRIFPEYFFDWLTEDAKARQKEEAVKKVRRKKKSA